MRARDLTNQKFGSLLVIERRGSDKNGQALWLCKCDCGKEKIIRGHDLVSKNGTKSCGCSRIKNCGLYKHGFSKTRLHTIWRCMQDRCYNPNNKSFNFYRKRGIKLCNDWLSDFINFYNWATTHGYKEDLTIDRIDSNKDYSPDNCRWVDRIVQANNTRRNRILELNGKKKTLSEWSKVYGINSRTILTRLGNGWSIEKALTQPVKRNKRKDMVTKIEQLETELEHLKMDLGNV